MGAAAAERAGEISVGRPESSASCGAGPVRWDAIAHAIRSASVRRSRARTSAAGRARTSYFELVDCRHLLWLAVTTDYLELVDRQHVLLLAAMPDYLRLRKDDC